MDYKGSGLWAQVYSTPPLPETLVLTFPVFNALSHFPSNNVGIYSFTKCIILILTLLSFLPKNWFPW